MPLDLQDFPPIVATSIELFNRLPDRYCSTECGPLYTGKDINSLPILYDLFYVDNKKTKRLVLQIIQHLDSKATKKDAERINKLAKKSKQNK